MLQLRITFVSLIVVFIVLGINIYTAVASSYEKLQPSKVVTIEKDATLVDCTNYTCYGYSGERKVYTYDVPRNTSTEYRRYHLSDDRNRIHKSLVVAPGEGPSKWAFRTFDQHKEQKQVFMFGIMEQQFANTMPPFSQGYNVLRLWYRGLHKIYAWVDECWSSPCPQSVQLVHRY